MSGYDALSFRVYAGEFCRILTAVGLFQWSAKENPDRARVFCFARHDGLTMIAINGSSAAIGNLDMEDLQGAGIFAIPAAQVKAILALFDRRIPKDASSAEYVLEISTNRRETRVKDVSDLFDRDELVVMNPEEPDLAGTSSTAQLAMGGVSTVLNNLNSRAELDLTSGVHFNTEEIARIARAAKGLGWPLRFRAVGGILLAPIADEFVALTVASKRSEDEKAKPTPDETTLDSWRHRFDELLHEGVI